MVKTLLKVLIFFFFLNSNAITEENIMILKLKDGDVKIELFPDIAPKHVERIKTLANEGKYNNCKYSNLIYCHQWYNILLNNYLLVSILDY